MALGKITRLLTLFLPLLLCGCSRLMLEQRTFIRDIFIGEKQGDFIVGLWQEEENTLNTGEGSSLREAFFQAENQLEGIPFYGQTRRIILDAELSWEQLEECGEVLATADSGMPNVSLWFGKELPERKKCGEYLEQLEGLENEYSLTANLYELTRRKDTVILPCFEGDGLKAMGRTPEKTLEWEKQYAFFTLLMARELSSGSVQLDTSSGKAVIEAGSFYTALEIKDREILVRAGTLNGRWRLLTRKNTLTARQVEAVLKNEMKSWTEDVQKEKMEQVFFYESLKYHGTIPNGEQEEENNRITINFTFELN